MARSDIIPPSTSEVRPFPTRHLILHIRANPDEGLEEWVRILLSQIDEEGSKSSFWVVSVISKLAHRWPEMTM